MEEKTKKSTLTTEQQKIIDYDGAEMMVSASAGSGKTHTMISRLIRLITDGKADLSSVLALTFTDAAALDMKEKLCDAIEKKYTETNDGKFLTELSKIQYSDISTIDSFCKRLLKKYFYEAGISPDFAVADEPTSVQLKNRALDKVFAEKYEKGDKEFTAFVSRRMTSRSDKSLKKSILDVFNDCSTEADFFKLFDETEKSYTESSFYAMLSEYKSRIDKTLNEIVKKLNDNELIFTEEFPKCIAFNDRVRTEAEKLLSIKDVYEIKGFPHGRADRTESKLEDEIADAKNVVSDCFGTIGEIIADAKKYLTDEKTDLSRLSVLAADILTLKNLVSDFCQEYQSVKADENLLDFSDLERFTLNLLRNEKIRTEVKERYKYIFVDECQDINALQNELIRLISQDNVFKVGDVKQSIYGFRGSRPEFFDDEFLSLIRKKGAAENLNYNFRSAPNVINAVNAVFDYAMTDERYGSAYKGKADLLYGGLYDFGGKTFEGRAEFHLYSPEKKEKDEWRVYDLMREISNAKSEESDTAALITKIIADECLKTYFDLKDKTEKRVEYKDIAVIMRSIKSEKVIALIKALTARGIPVTSESVEYVGDYPEVSALISLLKLLDNFNSDVSLATVMKSPIGNFSDEELLEIALFSHDLSTGENQEKSNGKIGYKAKTFCDAFNNFIVSGEGELKEKVIALKKYLDDLRYLADFYSAREILKKVIADTDYKAQIMSSVGGGDKLRRVRFLLSAASVGAKEFSVKEFLSHIEDNPKSLSISGGGAENAVKVMTMHASKGLEFPVVIACGLEKSFNVSDSAKPVLVDRKYGFAEYFYNDESHTREETLFRKIVKDRISETREKEELRLLYVGLTRAKYSLNMTCVTKKDDRSDNFEGASRFMDYLPKNFPTTVHEEKEFSLINNRAERRKVIFSSFDEKTVEKMRERFGFIYPFESEASLPLKTTVTKAIFPDKDLHIKFEETNEDESSENDFVAEFADESAEEAQNSEFVKTGAERGTIAHRFMELYDFTNMPSVQDAAKSFVSRGEMQAEDLAKIDLNKLEKVIFSGAMDSVKNKTQYREKGFLVNLPSQLIFGGSETCDVLLQGKIDLLAVGDKDAEIFDYKYSVLSADKLKEKYAKQLMLYSAAVEKVLPNVKVTARRLINLISGEVITID